MFSHGCFYDDNGNEIIPLSVYGPGLCLLCKSYDDTGPEEKLLWLMTSLTSGMMSILNVILL